MSQYTMAGRVGGCERKTSLEVLEFGVDSADCSVQSAGSLLGGGLPKLAMSGGPTARANDAERTATRR